jgi:hypothetical protein
MIQGGHTIAKREASGENPVFGGSEGHDTQTRCNAQPRWQRSSERANIVSRVMTIGAEPTL